MTTEDPTLAQVLGRCSLATYHAALDFRRSGNPRHLSTIIRGVVARYVEPELRHRVENASDDLRLVEDLAMDSLTLMEVILLAEEVLCVSLSADELRTCRTLGNIQEILSAKLVTTAPSPG